MLASVIYQCLVSIQVKAGSTPFSIVKKECVELLKEKGFEPEYVELAEAGTLTILEDYDPSKGMVALIAARLGKIRLIDNMLIGDAQVPMREYIAHADAL
jgi:pantoate--beta-alanine ligase